MASDSMASVPTGVIQSEQHSEAVSRCTEEANSELLNTLTKSSHANDERESSSVSLWSLPRRKKYILMSLAITNFVAFLCFSILAPFFPKEADTKGISATTSGWIFACFALTQFIASPFCGKLMPIMGSRFMFLAGQFFNSMCTILFGMLGYIETKDGGTVFVIFCFLVRVSSALGVAAFATASFTIISREFSKSIGRAFGVLETFTGLGLMLGPAIGGALYDAGGFKLPFFVLGGFMLFTLPINCCILPTQSDEIIDTKPDSLSKLMLSAETIFICMAIMVAALVWSALDPTLEPHLRVFDLDPTMVGLIFLLMAAVYAMCSPVCGIIGDKMKDVRILLILGDLLCIVGLLFVGPSPLIGFSIEFNTLWMNLVSLAILGIGNSLIVTPSFDVLNRKALERGLEDNTATYGIVAGVWTSSYALGEFIGPIFAGWMRDTKGFEWCMTYIAFVCGASAVSLISLMLFDCKNKKHSLHNNDIHQQKRKHHTSISNERTPLLKTKNEILNKTCEQV